jgi:hypothetical protein
MGKNTKSDPMIFLQIILVFLLAAYPDNASTQEFKPVFKPTLEVNKINSDMKIDGKLDEPEWRFASRADNFVERYPGENLKPEVNTEAFITYDDDNLYVAFCCHDDPSLIRATMCQRDQFHEDDAVYVWVDTYGNAGWAYGFAVNPYGVQKDLLWSSITGDDLGFDLIWESAAMITDSSYQVEMAIPFTSIRFPNKNIQTWKVDFWREHPRQTTRQYSWAAYNHNDQCWVCQWGTVNGIKNVKPGKGLEILVTGIGNQAGYLPEPWHPDSNFVNDDADGEMSVGGKYSISSDITLEAAYNPDFSQIEADAAQIDVNSTISLLYPERRPFFQEGSDIFRTIFNSFYTRTVNDPQFAAKLTGRIGRNNIGFLSAYDENTPYIIPLEERSLLVNTGKSTVNILRGSRSFGDNNHLGFIVTDRRFEGGGYGTIAAVDGDIKLTPKYSVVGQYIISYTKEQNDSLLNESLEDITFDNGKHTAAFDGESYSGTAFITQFRRRARHWSFTADYNQVTPAYRTETGYDPWNDYRNFSIWTGYDFYPADGIIERISPQAFFNNRWNFDNEKKWTELSGSLTFNLKFAQTYFGISHERNEEKWGGIEFKNLWDIEFYTGSRFSNAIGYEAYLEIGQGVARWLLEKGDYIYAEAEIEIKPVDRLIIEPTINYSVSRHVATDEKQYEQTIGRVRFRFQANKELSLRLVVQYDDDSDNWDIDPLLTYRLSPFSVFYAGSTHDISELTRDSDNSRLWRQTSRQFFVKLQYLFRI